MAFKRLGLRGPIVLCMDSAKRARMQAILREVWPELEVPLLYGPLAGWPDDPWAQSDRESCQRALAVMVQSRCMARGVEGACPDVCLACGCARYCSATCQRVHATRHRTQCVAMAELKVELKGMVYSGHWA